jgi:hypothetical protein
MTHATECTGCPHCDPEMAAIMRDSAAGRYESLANRGDAITHRTLRALGAKANHPAYRALRSRDVKSPTTEDLVSAVEMFRNASRRFRDTGPEHLVAILSAAQSKPMTTRAARTPGTVPAAPDLAAAIRAARKE